MKPEPTRRALLRLGLALLLVALAGCSTGPTKQDEVAARGRQVMPFDLDKTTHRFTPVNDGLLEEVTADDPSDAEQARLVREHLTREAERFRGGDYSDPTRIHGKDMPGLAELERGAGRIEISYRQIGAGASLRFRTEDSALVKALHAWGEAQVSDHGSHAEQGG